MKEILALVNENWEKILKLFGVKIIKEGKEILNYQGAILLLSEDRKNEIETFLRKIEENEIIIGELPANKDSQFEIEDVQRLMSKILGFSIKQ
jgi:vacuolar-type H+-ATPase subunit F/Vma7